MDHEEQEKRSFINEQIVPRKKIKKILLAALLVLVLGGAFGMVAGITFYISQNIMGKSMVSESQPEAIIFARDDTEAAEEETEPEEIRVTIEAETEMTPETVSEGTVSESTDAEEGSAAEENASESTESEPPESAETTVTETEIPEAKEVYASVSAGFVTVAVISAGGVDWFDQTMLNREERFGVTIAESDENLFILMEGTGIAEGSEIRVDFGTKSVAAELFGVDSVTGLAVLRLQKKDLTGVPLQTVPLGNSFPLELGDRLYLVGAPYHSPIAIDEGMITYCEKEADVEDGYAQLFSTDMLRAAGGSAVLLNEDGEIVCWVSDYSAGASERVTACGISSLKYIIEDLCSGRSTAYLGVSCVTVNETESIDMGLPEGLYVRELTVNSPAYEAGLQAGDRIVSVNGKTVFSGHSLQNRMDALKSGDTVTVEVERRGVDQYETLLFQVTLGER